MNTVVKPDIDVLIKVQPEFAWNVILNNCYCHFFEEVVQQIIEAIGCDYIKASQLANVADKYGSVTVYKGDLENCERVCDILGSIGLDVKVTR